MFKLHHYSKKGLVLHLEVNDNITFTAILIVNLFLF
jgi:hypothetical protein